MEREIKSEKENNNILSQRDKSGELEIISEEKNVICSEENTNQKCFKKSETPSITNSKQKNNLKHSPKFLFENEENELNEDKKENDVCDLMNYLSDDNYKNVNIKEENNNRGINNLSKSYNQIKEIITPKEEIENNKIELPLSNRLNISGKFGEDNEKEKNKESLSRKGALKILQLITSKRKEREEIEKKKEELIIETFKKARNENDKLPINNLEKEKDKDKENIATNDKMNIFDDKNNIIDNDLKKEEITINKNANENEGNKENNKLGEENNILSNKEQNDNKIENLGEKIEILKKNEIIIKEIENNKESNENNEYQNNNTTDNDENINKIIPFNNKNKLYIKNSRKFLKKPIETSNSKGLTKSSFSISKQKPKIKEEKDTSKIIKKKRNKEKDEITFKYKSFKNQSKTKDNQNIINNKINNKEITKSEFQEKEKTKDNFDTVTIYKKQRMSKSPKGKIYAPKKALNPRGSSLNKYNEHSLLSKSNININNVNYINNINTIIKNRNDNFNDNYNEDNFVKLNNSLNIHMNNNNYNNIVNDYKYIDNYAKYNKNELNYNIIRNYNSNFENNNKLNKKDLLSTKTNNTLKYRQKVEGDNLSENINIKNKFKNNSNKNFILNKFTPDKYISHNQNTYKPILNTNPQRILKNKKMVPSIYQNKFYQNNTLSQRYYIYNNNNNNQDISSNNSTGKNNNCQKFFDLNNDIITTEESHSNTNTKIDKYNIDYENNINKKNSISINIEDLMIYEEKFTEIIYFLKNGKEVKNQCFDFWNYFYNCSLFERIEKIFKTEKNIELAKLSINLELITVMICYEFSFDINILNKSLNLLLEILEICHRNLMIICENILMKIIPENQSNIWAMKLNNLVKNSKKYLPNNFSNLSHIELISINSSELSKRIQNIFSLYETEYSPLINSLFKKIYQKSYNEINDFFIEYILKIENKESSILAPVLLSSNPNFISFRPPYIHTERIKPYTLILDLNDTIINFQQTNNSQGILRLRPFLIEFLEEISHYYELILFTTSTEYFSKPIINAIEENKKYFDFVFYREYAIIVGNDFVKDLTRVGRALDSTIIVDNMPQNFRLQKENGIHIKPFFAQDPNDNTLLELTEILINIAKSGVDVREGLAQYRNDIVQKVTSNISKYNI